uniref:Uncharacterized protein n=1 Tax=Percolomonas cosmopolitus TaxID=63605 RepID=A0A7S1PJF9_9EUKA|mmetsp:Transcript_642/g.2239  ORF Transcript_642/g.2239 Transcript_642/m.2239 type:complete len:569 (+) Transcript_642:440-2146(+)
MFSHLLIKSMYSTIALLTEKIHDLRLESQGSNEDKFFEWRICLGWRILLRNDWVTEYMIHSCGSSLSFFAPSVGNQITVDHETNLGNLTPQDAATHVVAQLKNQLLHADPATTPEDGTEVKILKRETFTITKQSPDASHIVQRNGFQIWVQIQYLEHTFTRRIVAFNVQDDDMIIFQQDAPHHTPIEVDFGDRIICSIEPHDSRSNGQLVLFRENIRIMLPDAKYEVKVEEDLTFRAVLTSHTGTVIEGLSMNQCEWNTDADSSPTTTTTASIPSDSSATLDKLDAQLSSYYGKVTRRVNIGAHQCVLVSYESESNLGHRYRFNDIGVVHHGEAYIITAFTKPDRFEAFQKRVFDCIRTLAFYAKTVHNDFLEYYNIQYGVRIKVPRFMTVFEDLSGDDSSFVVFKSENFVTTLSKTHLSHQVNSIEDLRQKIIFDIGQSFSSMEQVDIKQTRVITLGSDAQGASITAFQVTHVSMDHVNQARITYLNTYALLPDKQTVFRIQSSASKQSVQVETLRMFLNMHRSFNTIAPKMGSPQNCSTSAKATKSPHSARSSPAGPEGGSALIPS